MSTALLEPSPVTESWELLDRLDKDMRAASRLMSREQARHMTDLYYQIQHVRIAAAAQVRASDESDEPSSVQEWIFESTRRLEDDVKRSLGEFASGYTVGIWCQSICGIGPVISAGLLASFDIRVAKTVGHFWRFAGLDPTLKWEKKTKRPWNAGLKTLCAFKLGECFVKVQNRDKDFYGKHFAERKAIETERNERGDFADQAAAALEAKSYKKTTDAYKHYSDGHLPPAHVHARARRYAVKLFLSHLHHVMYVDFYGEQPPVPFAFEHCGGDHRHFIEPPNWPMAVEGKPLGELLTEDETTDEE